MKIAIFSLADINNYGDVFFPYLLREEIKERLPDSEVDIITNTAYSCSLFESVSYNYEMLSKYDALIMGGGELISPFDNQIFRKTYGKEYSGVPSDIAFGWLDVENAFKAWFSIGAHPILWEYSDLIANAMEKLDFISVRGTISKKVLECDFRRHENKIRVMPDLGWLFPKYIDSYATTNETLRNLISQEKEYMVFQAIEDIDFLNNIDEVIEELVSFSHTSGINVVCMPIMKTKEQWGEDKVLEVMKEKASKEMIFVSDDIDILDIGIVLKNAKFFVGSSLHGAVTSMAYGKPAVNIRGSINTKLQDVHSARCRSSCFANDWNVLGGVLERLTREANNEEDTYYAQIYSQYQQYRVKKELDNLMRDIQKCKDVTYV